MEAHVCPPQGLLDLSHVARPKQFDPLVHTAIGDLPTNVFMVIAHTFMFSPTPANNLPKATGYDLIAGAFASQLP